MIDFFKKYWDTIASVVSTIIIYFLSSVQFPKIDNENLLQTTVDLKNLTFFLMMAVTISFLVLTKKVTHQKASAIFISVGLLLILGWLLVLFWKYYPFANKNIRVVHECESNFLIGNKIKFSKRLTPKLAAENSPEWLILNADCNPENIWTLESIEANFNRLFLLYFILILLFSLGILSIIQAAYQATLQ